MAYDDDDGTFSAANHQLLNQLSRDVREIRRAQEKQAEDIANLRVDVASIRGEVAALKPEGRAEAYMDSATIRQALWLAMGVLLLLGIYWITRAV